jgi:hypothetical protein
MTEASTALLITSGSTLVITVVKMVLDYLARRDDRAERLRVADALAEHTTLSTGMVVKKINETKEINVAALDAANGLKETIRAEGLQLRGPSRQSDHKPEGA